jgi:menaquinone-dependent protoporphyrinogen oxidase
MKILIIYASVTGTAEECVNILKNNLSGHDVTLCDLGKRSFDGDLTEYDSVVVGGPVRYGKLHKSVSSFIKENATALETIKTSYFLCAAFSDRIDDYFEIFLTPTQRKNSVCLSNFGGDLSVDKQKNFFMKLLVRSMRNEITENGETDDIATTRVLPTVNPTEISKLADIITGKNI